MALLEVNNLMIQYPLAQGKITVVDGISFSLNQGETLAVVGESGSGKTQSVLSLMGLLPDNAEITGMASLEGKNLFSADRASEKDIRGKEIGMIFQDPMTSLNPYLTIEQQMSLAWKRHFGEEKNVQEQILMALQSVRLPDPKSRLRQYPHELSGGMRQRVMIASVLMLEPKVLIADEPTTALDVTVQAQILALIGELKKDLNAAILFITHDLGVVAGISDRVLVMEKGKIVEQGTPREIYHSPTHPYTKKLIASIPRLDQTNGRARLSQLSPIVEAESLVVNFRRNVGLFKEEVLQAVRGIDVTLRQGEILGIVGESGCGKSTFARALATIIEPSSGKLRLFGQSFSPNNQELKKEVQKNIQIIFQDPMSSMNPRMNIGSILSEPLWTHAGELSKEKIKERVVHALQEVGLDESIFNRFPHEFSGGQCQRIIIARALILKPKVILCDEPVSALDVSIRKQVLDLLFQVKEKIGASLIFISHDLSVVRHLCDRVIVMYLGQALEVAPVNRLFDEPKHPYTRALINAVPIADPDIEKQRSISLIKGDPPSPIHLPTGCSFIDRCPNATNGCELPQQLRLINETEVSCHLAK
jgi:oligopeptide/dipeptide ABC transporter ATP-binding protein